MLGMSRAGVAERFPVLVGAVLSVSLGVALVQSSLLLLISAATLVPPEGLDPAERMRFDDNATAAVAVLGVVMGAATFLGGFIVSSTFAFTVTQRRRDLALLRLAGGSRRQVRRLLLGEAVLLGSLGAAVGIPAGLGVMAIQTRLLVSAGFVPHGFTGEWRSWILAVSLGTGVVLALGGALVAARRAGQVRPLEALRDTGASARVMTASRWIAGLLFTGGAAAMVIVAPHAGAAGGQAVVMNIAMPAVVALAAFSPFLVPLLGRLVPTGAGVAAGLARANLRDDRRRSASVAAPLIVLVGLVFGNAGAGTSIQTSAVAELRERTRADLVVDGTGPIGAAVAAVPGVAAASTEASIPAIVRTGHGEDIESEGASALVIDPASYLAAHPGSDAVARLSGRGVAAGPGGGVPQRGTVRVGLPGTDLGELPVLASVPETLSGGAGLLLPPDVVPPALLADAPTRSFVSLAPDADPAAVAAALAAIGTVSDLDSWLRADAKNRASTNDKVMLIVLGLGGLYALIGVVNSVVIGAATRRREFATARVTGLGRGQVVGSALLEAVAVAAAGIVLGGLAAGSTFVGVLGITEAVTGTATLDLPWTLVAVVVGAALMATATASVVTSWVATRPAPITLMGAEE
ncbi:FtsX-like permease family protein [Micromonospora parathelypteridis]|uniref:Putative ABC transport system permease protein n=1 Tax=Micromonospora parathelypteridis TaxID=1839617 RepID=A0A840W858_9ACTN|nr:FtsX-like permease family protein [Micromonospora parathelypteridis]MBB5481218.1 putative ABC transport system permease protein [Micromonospora parathelypteridis]GGO19544.1 ABC transporter permease [Micromonospora parathelypteridis]